MSGGAPPSHDDLVGEAARRVEAPARRARRRDRRASATVAERPIVVSPGASFRSRARSSARRSPRFETTSECSSSKITVFSRAEEAARILRGKQQRHLLRRGEQDVGRIELLALPLIDRRVAGARLEPDRQAHLCDRRFEVAMDVDGERLKRRDVKRMWPDHRLAGFRESRTARPPARSTRLGRNPANVLPAPVGAISSTEFPACAFAKSSI